MQNCQVLNNWVLVSVSEKKNQKIYVCAEIFPQKPHTRKMHSASCPVRGKTIHDGVKLLTYKKLEADADKPARHV